jgi:hypothetical protein
MNKCMACSGDIAFGTPFVSLNLHRETFDGDGVNVIEARGLIMWCEQCACDRFSFVCADDPRRCAIPVPIEDDGKMPCGPHAALAAESPSEVNILDTIEVYLAGLAQDDPAITEGVRAHIHSLVADGNATFLTILLEAIRNGLADS